jgi:hypothetical protein
MLQDTDEAPCGLDMVILLDPADTEVRAAADAAREILTRLEAAPFIARLEASLARSEAAGGAAAPTPPASVARPRRSCRPEAKGARATAQRLRYRGTWDLGSSLSQSGDRLDPARH